MLSLVTGAAGFVGQAVVRRLLADGDDVRGLALPGDARLAELRAIAAPPRLQVIEADVTDAGAVVAHFAGVARVFHTAALVHSTAPWAAFEAVNVGGTSHVARAAFAAGVQRFVHVSTSDVFGLPRDGAPIDEATPLREWGEPYPDTKIAAERFLWAQHRAHGLPLSVIYPCWVYGPGDAAFFPSLAQAISDGFMLFWRRDLRLFWVYIDNLADAIVLAGTDPRAIGQGYLVHDALGAEAGPTLQAVCARIAAQLGKPAPTRHVPYALAYATAWLAQSLWRTVRLRGAPPMLTNDVKSFGFDWQLSNAKLRALGWTPRVSIADGMDAALAALRQRLAAQ
ncbi:MAG: NAD-dependent epimerase/dehydratase family protein [Candidatus Binatia bacterium]